MFYVKKVNYLQKILNLILHAKLLGETVLAVVPELYALIIYTTIWKHLLKSVPQARSAEDTCLGDQFIF